MDQSYLPVIELGETLSCQDNEGTVSYSKNKSKPFKEALGFLHRNNLKRFILVHLNMNSIHNKFDLLTEGCSGNVSVIIISETKTDETFPAT